MSRWRGRLIAAGVTVVYCALAVLSVQRTGEYSSRTGIWQTVLDRRPHGRAHYSLAMELKEEGRRDEAMRHYRLALADTPEAHYALAFELNAEGKRAEAIPHFRDYVRLLPNGPNIVRAYLLMGRALASEGELDEATAAFRQVLSMQPSNVDARGGLADSLLRRERFEEAVTHSAEYVRAQPGNALAHHNLGVALAALDRIDEAVGEFARRCNSRTTPACVRCCSPWLPGRLNDASFCSSGKRRLYRDALYAARRDAEGSVGGRGK
jgi:tetratricopeptide (TPR) repeat protein